LKLSWSDFLLSEGRDGKGLSLCRGMECLELQVEGVSFKYVVEMVKPREAAKFVFFKCADGYSTSLPLVDLLEEEAFLAYRLDGKDLEEELGGPLRLFVPNKYCYKSAMWLTRIWLTSKRSLVTGRRGVTVTARMCGRTIGFRGRGSRFSHL